MTLQPGIAPCIGYTGYMVERAPLVDVKTPKDGITHATDSTVVVPVELYNTINRTTVLIVGNALLASPCLLFCHKTVLLPAPSPQSLPWGISDHPTAHPSVDNLSRTETLQKYNSIIVSMSINTTTINKVAVSVSATGLSVLRLEATSPKTRLFLCGDLNSASRTTFHRR